MELWTAEDEWGNIESPSEHFNLTGTSDEEESTDTVESTDYPSVCDAFLDSRLECIDPLTALNLSDVSTYPNRREVYTASAARKFGFMPSKNLSQSLMKVASDGCVEVNSSVSSGKHFDADTSVIADRNCMHNPLKGGSKASFGVSEMLCVLKQYVEKSRYSSLCIHREHRLKACSSANVSSLIDVN